MWLEIIITNKIVICHSFAFVLLSRPQALQSWVCEYSNLSRGCLSSSSRSETYSSIWQQSVSWIGKEIPQTGWQTDRTVPPAGGAEEWPHQAQTQACIIHVNATKGAMVIRMLSNPSAQRQIFLYSEGRIVFCCNFLSSVSFSLLLFTQFENQLNLSVNKK